MKTRWVGLLAILATACEKKVEATPVADAGATAQQPTSCLHAQNARAYVWRQEPLEMALDVELDWTCPTLAGDKLELIDTDVGAALGDQKVKERYRIDKVGDLAEWDDPFLSIPRRLRGLFLYSLSAAKVPTSVSLRYGGVRILPSIPVVVEQPKVIPKPAMRVVATSAEPGREKGTTRLTALIELTNVPRSAGRMWKGRSSQPAFFLTLTGDDQGSTIDANFVFAERVLDVDEKLLPSVTSVTSLPARPAKRLILAEMSASPMKRMADVTLNAEGRLKADAEGAAKLVLPKETRARLDATPPSTEIVVE